MERRRSIPAVVGLVLSIGLVVSPWNPSRAEADLDKVAISVARLLEQGHYSRQKVDNRVSEQLLDQYLEDLDPSKLFFLQADIDEFQRKYRITLDDAIISGDLSPAREIFGLYKERLTNRVEKNKEFLEQDFNFSTDEVVELDRKDAAWPRDMKEADDLWARRIEAELLQETLNEHAERAPKVTIAKRQDQLLRNVEEMDDEAVVSDFLSALARTYDPHSEYLSPSELENFEIQMSLSLEGVGAVLQSEDGYAKVKEVVPGGPADLDGRLGVNDRITAVAQGDGPFEDVVDMKLDKVVEKIRGKRGTTVRLQVIPGGATDPSKREIIAIRRDEVSLKDQEAQAEIVDMKRPDGSTVRIGWIELPSFYADMDNRGSDARSTTKDVRALLDRLMDEKIEGLVIDLRQDGGGSLEEAINLTGLFIPHGPVVQSKNPAGDVTVSFDENRDLVYDGPLVVLMNRLSASASEIFAAALQDYGRAVIVGDERSFGKGTVQTMLDIGRYMPMFSLGSSAAGALKLTINKFYRVRGGSTQLEGVKSDIVLPSITDNPEIGESALPNPLPYDEVAPQRIRLAGNLDDTIEQLRTLSSARIATDPEFGYMQEDLERLHRKIEENAVSLNIDTRREEIEAEKARKAARKAEREERGPAFNAQAFELTLDNVDADELKLVDFDRKRNKALFDSSDDEDDEVMPDAVRNEALRIAADLVDLKQNRQTAAVADGTKSAETGLRD